MLWGAFALALGGCSATELVGGAACSSSQLRCGRTDSGFVFQTCGSDNQLLTSAVCSANQVCDENLGCIDCFPGTSICNDTSTAVHSCSGEGTIGPLVLACGAGQVCQSGHCVENGECGPPQALCGGTCTQISSDPNHCGACGTSCLAGAVHASWSCKAGTCSFDGCQPGYYDLDGDKKCEYACSFVSASESCNGIDDNCNGLIDEGVAVPSPAQVCGVSPKATAAECTTGVRVACQAGAWKCTFPTGVCSPSCAAAVEIADKLDNDCDGLVDEP